MITGLMAQYHPRTYLRFSQTNSRELHLTSNRNTRMEDCRKEAFFHSTGFPSCQQKLPQPGPLVRCLEHI